MAGNVKDNAAAAGTDRGTPPPPGHMAGLTPLAPHRDAIALVLIFAVSLVLHFWSLSRPDFVVFDEQWFANFANSYFTHLYYYDIHPPLGKELLAFFGWLFGYQAAVPGFFIGDTFPNAANFVPFRQAVALFGSFLPVIVYLIARQLRISFPFRVLAALLVLLDNALLLQSRLVLIDIFLIDFSLLAMLAYLMARNCPPDDDNRRWMLWGLVGLCAALAVSVKFVGGSVFVAIIACELLVPSLPRPEFLKKIAVCAVIIGAIYVISYVPHFAALDKERDLLSLADPLTSPGKGATSPAPYPNAYFRLISGGFSNQFITLQSQLTLMLSEVHHPYESRFYTWPFMYKPIYYGLRTGGDKNEYLYLFGNPIVWAAGLVGAIGTFSALAVALLRPGTVYQNGRQKGRKGSVRYPAARWWPPLSGHARVLIILVIFYLVTWLPFIITSRATFLYHYFTPLCISLIAFAYACDRLPLSPRPRLVLIAGIVLLALAGFLYYSPVTFSLPLSYRELSGLFILSGMQ